MSTLRGTWPTAGEWCWTGQRAHGTSSQDWHRHWQVCCVLVQGWGLWLKHSYTSNFLYLQEHRPHHRRTGTGTGRYAVAEVYMVMLRWLEYQLHHRRPGTGTGRYEASAVAAAGSCAVWSRTTMLGLQCLVLCCTAQRLPGCTAQVSRSHYCTI
jgi:hypothetical protein